MGLRSFLLKLILKSAISFEEDSYNLYVGAAGRAENEESRKLLLSLAAEEQGHKGKLSQLLKASAGVPVDFEEEEDFEELDLPGFDRSQVGGKTSKEILEFALQREIFSMRFYLSLAQRTPLAPARDMFRFLAHEEKIHKDRIAQELERLFGKGVQ